MSNICENCEESDDDCKETTSKNRTVGERKTNEQCTRARGEGSLDMHVARLRISETPDTSKLPNKSKQLSLLELTSEEVLLRCMLPFCGTLAALTSLASTSQHMRQRCYARLTFPVPPIDVCIDKYCPLCPLRKEHAQARGAMSLISHFPLQTLKMHCFVTDVPHCLEALAIKRTIVSLELKLTNKSFSCSLESILPPNLNSNNFPTLRQLTLDSSHLQHVNLAGRVRLLTILGARLRTLILSGTSSTGLVGLIGSLCPQLEHLRVDRVKSSSEMEAYKSNVLRTLDLRRVSFLLSDLHHALPNLQSLRYSSASRLEPSQIDAIISSLPKIGELSLEISGRDVNIILNSLSRNISSLKHLTLEGAYDSGFITASALARNTSLVTLVVKSVQSVTPLLLDDEALLALAHMPCLTSATLPYTDSIFASLFAVLSSSNTLQELVFWERRKWVGVPKWLEIEHTLAVYSVDFPSIKLALKDLHDI